MWGEVCSVECVAWRVECEVWGVVGKCGVWKVEWGVCGVGSGEYGVWSVKCAV